ncbi:putative tubulin binding cofactor A-like protein [Trypanosoma cruzi]|uniref:Tubulin-specific chaperone A n=2 Tax=Trypanosoma cruzi TaxID=5693 RepID=Q4CT87_TRYCC|nr:tubulin binding cofactor A-like protein, putative [Trypanosoma cruzi]EAN83488.1 tubulin binding cofactor A-like protein, putative [Trypanosoma cruzi]PWU98212.1 putative tubulin binding cofactor A-like protein [Trypanosoma cruzi]RNC57333.1 tubulin binding cofactor A-like protein [Trypanosoma cruzi]|eukprot:XP_805339.1 tubulin binding cofactor A-like protein [Trypanosoma cruzi strain CL Brener]
MSTDNADGGNRFIGRTKQVEDPLVKSLRIKVNTLKRNLKDFEFAKKEVIRETSRLESIKENNPERVKQQEGVLGEAQMMVPHSENRVRTALKDLKEFLNEEDLGSRDVELLRSAHESVEEGERVLS